MSRTAKKTEDSEGESPLRLRRADVWDALAERVHAGDRQALAEFFVHVEQRLRRKFRRRLRPAIRRLWGSDDLCATAYLQLDEFLHRGGFVQARTGAQLYSLALRTSEHVIAAWERRLANENFAVKALAKASVPGSADRRREIAEMLMDIEDLTDRQLIAMRSDGHTWRIIADVLRHPAARLRKRFESQKRRLRKG